MATAQDTLTKRQFGAGTGAADLARLSAMVELVAGRSVRAALYTALFAVPLLITGPDAMFGYADVPRVAAVRVLAGVIAMAWLAHAAAGTVRTGRLPDVPTVFRHSRWISVSAAAFLLAAFVSAALSVSRKTAFLGAYPGFDSTDLYSLVTYITVGAAAARFLTTRRQVETAMWALASAGALASVYGIVQYAGLDPLHFDRFEVNDGRAPLTFGNPSFAGSFLTISLLVSAGLFFLQPRPTSRPGLLALSTLSLQVIALGLSASRGAWVGVTAGALLFAALAAVGAWRGRGNLPWRHFAMLAVPAVTALAGAVILLTGPSADSSRQAERLQSFDAGLLGSGLNGRQATWSATAAMVTQRPWLQGEPSNSALRHLFGYGPDAYRYAYQLVAPDEHVERSVPHAHNSFLNVLAELGIAGLLVWTALAASVTAAGVSISRDRGAGPPLKFISVVLTAAFAAHAVDQLVNVPRASDSMAMWALIGMAIALAGIVRAERHDGAARSSNPDQAQRQTRPGKPTALAIAAPPLALIAIAGIAVVTILGNAPHVMADAAAARLQSEMLRGAEVADIAEHAGVASRLSGDVAYYHSLEAAALGSAAQAAAASPLTHNRLTKRSLEARAAAAQAIPLSPAENLSYARSLLATGGSQAALERFELAARLSPNYWAVWLELAAAYAAVGHTGDGIAALEKAETLLSRQAAVTREDPRTLRNFNAVRLALSIEPG